jgi:hypothetical protein
MKELALLRMTVRRGARRTWRQTNLVLGSLRGAVRLSEERDTLNLLSMLSVSKRFEEDAQA